MERALPRKSLALPAAVALIGGALLLSSCLRSEPKPPERPAIEMTRPPAPPPSSPSPAPPQALRPAPPQPPSPRAAAPSPPPPAVFPPGPPAPGNPRYFELGLASPPRLPADQLLGPLEDLRPALPASGGDSRAALVSTISTFLDGLEKGSLAEATLLEGRRPLFEALLSELLEGDENQRPRAWRLGLLSIEGTEALASVALFGLADDSKGNLKLPPRVDGEIHARFEGDSWYIEDLSVPLDGLKTQRGSPTEPFSPPLGTSPGKGD